MWYRTSYGDDIDLTNTQLFFLFVKQLLLYLRNLHKNKNIVNYLLRQTPVSSNKIILNHHNIFLFVKNMVSINNTFSIMFKIVPNSNKLIN